MPKKNSTNYSNTNNQQNFGNHKYFSKIIVNNFIGFLQTSQNFLIFLISLENEGKFAYFSFKTLQSFLFVCKKVLKMRKCKFSSTTKCRCLFFNRFFCLIKTPSVFYWSFNYFCFLYWNNFLSLHSPFISIYQIISIIYSASFSIILAIFHFSDHFSFLNRCCCIHFKRYFSWK